MNKKTVRVSKTHTQTYIHKEFIFNIMKKKERKKKQKSKNKINLEKHS